MKRRVWLGFAAFCLLTGSRWLLDQVAPAPLPALLRTALHDAVLCLLLGSWCLIRGVLPPARWLVMAGWLAAIFVLPYAIIQGAGSTVTGFSETLVFTLVPVFVVFLVSQQDWEFGTRSDPRQLLGPALAGVLGATLVIEFRWPSSVEGQLWFGALVASAVLASFAAIRLHTMLKGIPVLPVAALAGAIIAVAGAAVSYADLPGIKALDAHTAILELAVTLLFDGPLLLLGLWLLRELSPIAYATRYLVFMVVTIVETYTIVRPPLVWTTVAGALLLAGASAWLLRERSMADSADTSSD